MSSNERKSLNSRNLFLNKYFNLIITILVILVLLFSFFIYLLPKYNSTKLIIKTNISTQKQLYAQQKEKLDTLKVISDLYNKISGEELSKFDMVLPSKYQIETLFGEFEEISLQGGWTLESVNWLDLNEEDTKVVSKKLSNSVVNIGSTDPAVGVIEVTIKFSNIDYKGIKNLISVLEKNLRLFDIINITFSGESTSEIILQTYYYEK